ncbi:ATP-binding protein [Myxococcota bacterium]|nr:ATP-binding protein [Myxococcota bacterium]
MTDDPVDALRTARLAELGLLAASLAHEVRQPLFAIKSLTQLADAQLARGGDAAHARSLLRSLAEQIELLERVVDGVRLYSRAPGESLSPVDCAACVEEVVALMRHRAVARRVTLKVELAEDLSAGLADPTALTQILANLTQNALDASPPDSVVVLRTLRLGDGLAVEVRDQGPGVPAALAERIFEPFFTTKNPDEGTGLGLALSRRLASAWEGRLELVPCESGACLRVTLPALGCAQRRRA